MIFSIKNYKINFEVFFLSFLILFLTTNRMFEYISNDSMVTNIIIIAISTLLLIFQFNSGFFNKHLIIKVLIILFLSNAFIFLVYLDFTAITLFFRNLSMLVVGYSLYFYRKNEIISLLIRGLFLFVVIYYLLYTSIIDVYTFTQNLSYSKNHIGTTVIYVSLLFYSVTYGKKNSSLYSLILLLILLRISVWTESRANIIVSLVGLFLYFIILLKNKKFYLKIFITMFLTIFILLFIINLNFLLSLWEDFFKNSFYVFEVKGLYDFSRTSIIYSYIKSTDFISFIFGKPTWAYTLLNDYGILLNNLHNSYLILHYRMGIQGIILGFIFLYNIYNISKLNSSLMLFILYFMIILRALTDTVFLDNFDFVIYFNIILVTFLIKKNQDDRRFDKYVDSSL